MHSVETKATCRTNDIDHAGPAMRKRVQARDSTEKRAHFDPESAAWVQSLSVGAGMEFEIACTRLHRVLVRIAMDEAFRRGPRYLIVGPELNDLAHQAAADALMKITRKIHDFRGDARFTTWAFRFVVLEVISKLGRHFWNARNMRIDSVELSLLPDRSGFDPVSHWQARELGEAVRDAVDRTLSAHQRKVFISIASGVSMETLAAELATNRNALYKTMFDARKKLRARLVAEGHLSQSK